MCCGWYAVVEQRCAPNSFSSTLDGATVVDYLICSRLAARRSLGNARKPKVTQSRVDVP